MVRNDQEATRFDALYMPLYTVEKWPCVEHVRDVGAVTKQIRRLVRATHSCDAQVSRDKRGRDLLCPCVTFFVSN